MPLQQQVNIDLAPAVPGQKATPDQSVYTPINYLASNGGVSMGTFCWASADAGFAQATPLSSEAPLGFVERVISSYLFNVTEGASLLVPDGLGLTIAVRGDYWVQTTEAATVGGQVYVDKTNGNILASVGSTGIAAPGWTFKTAGSANDMVIISNWTVPVASGGASGPVDLSNVTGTLAVANGGTGATTADAAFTALGGGSVGKLSSVDLTANVTNTLPIANGGTGATNVTDAKTNLEIS